MNNIKLDVIGLCETKLSDDTAKSYSLKNFNFYANNVTTNKGGVCLYVRNKYPCNLKPDLCIRKDYFETIFVDCWFNNKKSNDWYDISATWDTFSGIST